MKAIKEIFKSLIDIHRGLKTDINKKYGKMNVQERNKALFVETISSLKHHLSQCGNNVARSGDKVYVFNNAFESGICLIP